MSEDTSDSNKGSEEKKPSHLAKYSDLFDRLMDPTFLLDYESYVILEANPACERVLGTAPEELVSQNILDKVDIEYRKQFDKSLRICRRRYYPRVFESVWTTPNGRKVILEASACVLKLDEEAAVIQVVIKDVTAMKVAQAKNEQYLMELQTVNDKLEAISVTDEMTHLSNYRRFKNELIKEHERAIRYGTPYSIIFCDVDNFKHYNDTHGHPQGDEALKAVAKVLIQQARNTDLPARYGGEEFVVLAPGVNWEGAMILAERIRSGVEQEPVKFEEQQPNGKLTISVGVASFPNDGKTLETVLESADKAVYLSKKNGRNRVSSSVEQRVLEKVEEKKREVA